MSAPDGGDDFSRVFGSGKRLALLVVFGQVSVDDGLKVDDAFEDTPLEAAFGQNGEEPLDGVEPGPRGRGEVECEAWMASQPLHDFRMFMNGADVQDHVDRLAGRDLDIGMDEEANKFLMSKPLHTSADDGAVEHVAGREEHCGAVGLLILGHRPTAPLLRRQARLGAIQRLNLGFLVEGQHHGVRWWIHLKPDHITQPFSEALVVGQLELADPVKLQP
jgi:hypothetical protein